MTECIRIIPEGGYHNQTKGPAINAILDMFDVPTEDIIAHIKSRMREAEKEAEAKR